VLKGDVNLELTHMVPEVFNVLIIIIITITVAINSIHVIVSTVHQPCVGLGVLMRPDSFVYFGAIQLFVYLLNVLPTFFLTYFLPCLSTSRIGPFGFQAGDHNNNNIIIIITEQGDLWLAPTSPVQTKIQLK